VVVRHLLRMPLLSRSASLRPCPFLLGYIRDEFIRHFVVDVKVKEQLYCRVYDRRRDVASR
jgi:hypothetical protein